jgi:hypothetical protein
MSELLETLISEHMAALAEWDTEPGDRAVPGLNARLDAARDALFDHRPASLDEVRRKADYFSATRAFVEWDDFDQVKLVHALTPVLAATSDMEKLFAAFAAAQAAWRAMPEETEGGPEWDALEAVEHEIVIYPCRTIEDVQAKARFFLENEMPYDTIRNCSGAEEETLLTFLRSLLADRGQP